ncbi:hypothetical protein GCM10009828_078050 [Actinoplanes couchii]|uniref:Secreted protein n=1 Tax=Actinoplanes couchii TaxID=403638 RepID=A0ABQ3XFB3_9ACTN|nr:hypothetical protein Aco03nite_055880 [Actinoplanes couchii]
MLTAAISASAQTARMILVMMVFLLVTWRGIQAEREELMPVGMGNESTVSDSSRREYSTVGNKLSTTYGKVPEVDTKLAPVQSVRVSPKGCDADLISDSYSETYGSPCAVESFVP